MPIQEYCSDGEYIPQKNEETEVWALSTESRNIDEWEAVEKVERAVKSFLENFSFEYYYKKIDSTLRGPYCIRDSYYA